mmetsp:Transcript_11505/g.33898  ORF Transcript_11505/g.33898 Transcript_11505/m.33898 type:complete len:230 (-) Transcript_11505:194-883(-)
MPGGGLPSAATSKANAASPGGRWSTDGTKPGGGPFLLGLPGCGAAGAPTRRGEPGGLRPIPGGGGGIAMPGGARWTMALRSEGDMANNRRASSINLAWSSCRSYAACAAAAAGSFVFSNAPKANRTSESSSNFLASGSFCGLRFLLPRDLWTGSCGASSVGASCFSLLRWSPSGLGCFLPPRRRRWDGFLSAAAPFGSCAAGIALARRCLLCALSRFFARCCGSTVRVR